MSGQEQLNDVNSKVRYILWVPPDYSTSLRGGFPGPSPQLQVAAEVQALPVKSLSFPIDHFDGVDVLSCVWVLADVIQRPTSLRFVNVIQRSHKSHYTAQAAFTTKQSISPAWTKITKELSVNQPLKGCELAAVPDPGWVGKKSAIGRFLAKI